MNGMHRLATGLGAVQVAFDTEGAVIYLGFPDHEFRPGVLARVAGLGPVPEPPGSMLARLEEQLEAYATDHLRSFEVPFRLHGTTFELRVWAELQRIPFGETRTYGQLALDLGDRHLSRAVGRANGANPVSILVPCHRVIGASGALTGYAGGLDMKARLLDLERAREGARLPMD